MTGRAKGKRFVIRGKERLDVGLHEGRVPHASRFLLYGGRLESCPPGAHVGAAPPAKPYPTAWPRQQSGPNPVRRPTMLALSCRQIPIPPSGHANSPPRILPGGRPCWRCPAGKALIHRWTTPTGRPKSRPAADHVGAVPPAKPYATVGARQQSGPNPACRAPMLAPPRRQNLIPPSGHANRPAQIPPGSRPCWRLAAGKALSHRRATPTVRPESCLPAVHVGAPPSAKPYPTAGPRQQAGPNPAQRPSMLTWSGSAATPFYAEIYKPTIFVYILTVMV